MEEKEEVEIVEMITLECAVCSTIWTIHEQDLYDSLGGVYCPNCKNQTFDVVG